MISNLKPYRYIVSKKEWKIRMTFKHPSLFHFIIFKGKDPKGLATVLLDGDESISFTPQIDCSKFIEVEVTFKPSRSHINVYIYWKKLISFDFVL